MNTVQQKNTLTLGEDYILVWVESFLKERKAQNLTKNTIRYYRMTLKTFTDFLEGQEVKFISQITPNLIRDFFLILEERGHNPGGIHGHFRSVKAFLRWYWEELEPDYPNPIAKVKSPRVPQESLAGISKEDFEALVEECKSNTFYGERDKAILMVLYDTGVRANELCSINLGDINIADSSIFILQGKGRKPRMVFFGKRTRKQIRKWLTFRGTEGQALFTNRSGERLSYVPLKEVIRRLGVRTGVKASPHAFRRAFTLNCLNKGMAEITIARLLGHTSTVLIGRYAKQTTVDLMNSYKSPLDD